MQNELIKKENDIDKLNSFQNKYSFIDSSLSEISITEDGVFTVGSEQYKYTGPFLNSLSKLLKIPFQYAKQIPVDLLSKNVNRLKGLHNQPIKMCHRNGVMVNTISTKKQSHFQNVLTGDVLEYFNNDSFKINKSIIGDNGAWVDFIHKDLGVVERAKGDIIEIGYRIRNPFTMFGNRLEVLLFANQLVCTNGMTMPRNLFNVGVNLNQVYGEGNEYIERLRNSIDKSISKGYSLNNLADLFLGMSRTNINNQNLKKIFGSWRRTPELNFEYVFGFNWEEKGKDFMESIKEKDYELSDYCYFDTMYKMTEECQKYDLTTQIKVENYTGNLITMYEKQKKLMEN